MKGAKAGKNKTSAATRTTRSRPKAVKKGPSREQIAQRAYELYLARGREDGHADEDWLRAERELQPRKAMKR